MFTAALFTIARTWKEYKCPLTDDCKIWYINTKKYYSVIKKNEIMPLAATQMDLEILILSEVSQRKTIIVWLIWVSLKKVKINLSTKEN